eukprot:tig00000113_g5591.t1
MAVSITPDGGITKKILKDGTGPSPVSGNVCEVHYTGYLPSGDQFDSSEATGYPFQFDLGKGKVIQAWDLVVPTMKKGERCELIAAPQYAYGEEGCEGDPPIPPNTQLRFVMELLDFKSTAGRTAKTMSDDRERLAQIRREREEALKKREQDKIDAAAKKAAAAPEPAGAAAGAKGPVYAGHSKPGHGGHKKH